MDKPVTIRKAILFATIFVFPMMAWDLTGFAIAISAYFLINIFSREGFAWNLALVITLLILIIIAVIAAHSLVVTFFVATTFMSWFVAGVYLLILIVGFIPTSDELRTES